MAVKRTETFPFYSVSGQLFGKNKNFRIRNNLFYSDSEIVGTPHLSFSKQNSSYLGVRGLAFRCHKAWSQKEMGWIVRSFIDFPHAGEYVRSKVELNCHWFVLPVWKKVLSKWKTMQIEMAEPSWRCYQSWEMVRRRGRDSYQKRSGIWEKVEFYYEVLWE